MSRPQLGSKFPHRINRRVHFATNEVVRAPKRGRDLSEPHCPDHDQVHIAASVLRSARHRTVDERDCHLLSDSRQGFPQHVGDTCRLYRQRFQFTEDRRRRVRLEMDLIAALRSQQ